jgi:hypothetical protein
MSVRCLWGGAVVALVLVGAGCGGNSPVSVRGTVTLDGQPVEGATVLFLPEGGGRQATGQTGADGSFRLTTIDANDGAFPGNYKVVVQYTQGVEAPPAGNVRDAMQGQEKARKAAKKVAPKYVIPARYSDPGKTELRQAVPTDGPVTLALVSK